MQNDTRITDRNAVFKVVTKFYSGLYKAPEEDSEIATLHNLEDIHEVQTEELESA